MLVAGAVEGDDDVAEVVLPPGLADAVEGGLEVAAARGQGRRLPQRAAVEVGAAIAGACLGAVAGDDAEVFGADGLNPWRELAVGFLQDKGLLGPDRPCRWRTGQGNLLSSCRMG